jgi:hypothetical protein
MEYISNWVVSMYPTRRSRHMACRILLKAHALLCTALLRLLWQKNKQLCRILSSHSGDYEELYVLGHNVM